MSTLLDPPTTTPTRPTTLPDRPTAPVPAPRPAAAPGTIRHGHDRHCWWDLAAARWTCPAPGGRT